MFAATPQANIIHTLSSGPYMSSIEPATIIVGIEDSKPQKKRPTAIAEMCGASPTTREKPTYKNIETTYSLFRPKDSEIGEKNMDPIPWPKR